MGMTEKQNFSEQYAQAAIGDSKMAYLKLYTLGAIGMKRSMHFFIIGFSFSIDQTTHAASDACKVCLQAVQQNYCIVIAAIVAANMTSKITLARHIGLLSTIQHTCPTSRCS